MTFIYGVNPVKEALLARRSEVEKVLIARETRGKVVSAIITSAEKYNITVERVAAEQLQRVAGRVRHQGIVALLRRGFGYSSLGEIILRVTKCREKGIRAFVLVLDSVQDAGNVGSLIRAASCVGVGGVVIARDRACPVTAAVEKASAGGVSHVPVARVTNLARAVRELKEAGLWAVALEADGERDIYAADLSEDLALVVGGESAGVRRLVREACDECLSIPMAGPVGSLNAAQAGAIALFEALRQGLKG